MNVKDGRLYTAEEMEAAERFRKDVERRALEGTDRLRELIDQQDAGRPAPEGTDRLRELIDQQDAGRIVEVSAKVAQKVRLGERELERRRRRRR